MKYLKINEWAKLGNLFWGRVGYFRREQSDEELIVSFCDKYLQQFDEYESSDNSFTYIDAARAYYTSLLLVHCTTHINNVDRVLFRDKALLTYSEFLNITQYFGYMAHLLHPETQKFFSLFSKEMENVSLERIMQSDSIASNLFSLSEYGLFDTLCSLGRREQSTLIEFLETDRETKARLKKAIYDGDEETFADTIIDNNIVFDRCATVGKLYKSIKQQMPLLCDITHIEGYTRDEMVSVVDQIIEDPSLGIEQEESSLLYSLRSYITGDMENAPDIDWSYVSKLVYNTEALYVWSHRELSHLSTDARTVSAMNDFIEQSEYYKNIDECLCGGMSCEEYSNESPFEQDFRKKFISQLELPHSIQQKKESKDYINSNRIVDRHYAQRVYSILAEEGLLRYNEDTFYSFVYRLSHDYRGEQEPGLIVWYGQTRDLYYFLNWYCEGGDSRMWKKMTQFFTTASGEPLKTNGVINQAKTPSIRMEKVISKLI